MNSKQILIALSFLSLLMSGLVFVVSILIETASILCCILAVAIWAILSIEVLTFLTMRICHQRFQKTPDDGKKLWQYNLHLK